MKVIELLNRIAKGEHMRLSCYGKEDITQPIKVSKDERKKILQEIIIATIRDEEHLGKNLKISCIDYLKDLFEENI